MENYNRRYADEAILDPTVDLAQYAAGDLLCEKLSFKVKPKNATHIYLNKIAITDLASQAAELNFIFFDSDPSASGLAESDENAAFDPADADADKYTGHVVVATTDYEAFANNSVATHYCNDIQLNVKDGTIYLAIEVGGTSTPDYVAAGDLRIRIAYWSA